VLRRARNALPARTAPLALGRARLALPALTASLALGRAQRALPGSTACLAPQFAQLAQRRPRSRRPAAASGPALRVPPGVTAPTAGTPVRTLRGLCGTTPMAWKLQTGAHTNACTTACLCVARRLRACMSALRWRQGLARVIESHAVRGAGGAWQLGLRGCFVLFLSEGAVFAGDARLGVRGVHCAV
jgi:hypothetical protein